MLEMCETEMGDGTVLDTWGGMVMTRMKLYGKKDMLRCQRVMKGLYAFLCF